MNLESLRIFCDVAQFKSFSRGAQANHVSQSAASQAISQIERRLGAKLIDRSTRPLGLTAEGKIYLEGCRDVLDRYEAVEARTRAVHEQRASRLTVASIYSVGLYDMHQYVRRYEQRFPGGQVRLDFVHPATVYQRVLDAEADLGLVSFSRTPRELSVIPWRREPMVLVCYPAHRFVAAGRATMADLNNEDFVAFDQDLAIRRAIDRFLRQRRACPHAIMSFDNVEAIKRGVESGAGVSILPAPTLRNEIKNGSLVVVPVAGLCLERPLSIIHRRRKALSAGMAAFIELLTDGGRAPELDAQTPRPRHRADPSADLSGTEAASTETVSP